MKKILDLMEQKLKAAFTACGYEDKFAKVVLSNGRICASTSATEPWQQPRRIKPSRLILQMR